VRQVYEVLTVVLLEDSDLQQKSTLLFDRHITTFQTHIVPSSSLLPLPLLPAPHSTQLRCTPTSGVTPRPHPVWRSLPYQLACHLLRPFPAHNYVTHPIFPNGYIPGTARPCRWIYYIPSKCWTILDQQHSMTAQQTEHFSEEWKSLVRDNNQTTYMSMDIQPVAYHYTDWATPAHRFTEFCLKLLALFRFFMHILIPPSQHAKTWCISCDIPSTTEWFLLYHSEHVLLLRGLKSSGM
jgi:hypothetical protein